MTDNLAALAGRVEQAEGPSRELDAEIALAAVAGTRIVPNALGTALALNDQWFTLPAYTASLDAAMTLVPEGWNLRQMNFSAPCADDRKWHLNLYGGREGEDTFVGRGAAPALALVAAALRARSHNHDD